MKALQFDLWVASHASQFALRQKHKPADGCKPAAFTNRAGHDRSLAELQRRYKKHLKRRSSSGATAGCDNRIIDSLFEKTQVSTRSLIFMQ